MKLYPSLVIGLGGLGQQVVVHLKKGLLEACGGVLPPQVRLLAFDTVKQVDAQVGERGAVTLGPEEYVYLGGDLYDLMGAVERGEHPQIGSWLQTGFYLSKLPRNIFNLEAGVGQHRQLGRLALFYDLHLPAQSRICNALIDALRTIRRSTSERGLQVFIVGSLAGGTGSGMFVDLAHLVRQIAALPTVNTWVTLRGYLVLPEAFGTEVYVGMMKGMQSSAHAAMREIRRFTLNFDYKLGYPLYYHDHGTDPVWRGVVHTRLFDLLYYVDGQRARNSLADVPLKHGVTPTLADAISAVLDAEDPERPFQAYPLNVEAEVGQRRSRNDLAPDAATFGSVGTYTLVLPIHSLIEGWSHQLALEALNKFLAPAEIDRKTNLPLSLKDDANVEEEGVPGSEGARRFMQSTQVVDPFNAENQVNLTLLPAELSNIGRRYLNKDPDLLGELLDRDLKGWNDYFEPAGDDPVSINARLQARAVLAASLVEGKQRIKTSDELDELPVHGAWRIEKQVRRFKRTHLGRKDPTTGRRPGEPYRAGLALYADLHLERFRQALDLQMMIILNGQSQEDLYRMRCGKLGYLSNFLDQLYRDLEAAGQALDQVCTQRRADKSRYKQAAATARKACREMRERSGEKKFLIDTPRRAAYASQQTYLVREQALIDLWRGEIVEQVILETTRRMLAYVQALREQARAWSGALALAPNGLYGQVLEGLRQVEWDRQVARQIAVHHVIEDRGYEQERYDRYVLGGERDAVRDVLSGLTWSLEHREPQGDVCPALTLQVQIPAEGMPVAAKVQTDTRHNLDLLLAACRPTFERAKQDESIVDYLMYEYPQPEDLAEHIFRQGGPLLAYSGGNPLPAHYLRVWYDREKPQQCDYLERVMDRLTQLNNVGVGVTDERWSRWFARVVNSGDRFKCCLVHTEEIIELDRIEAFRSSRAAYLSVERANRSTLHLFPAEVNAVRYEDRLGELSQTPRLFSDDVVIQLEKLDSFRTFMFCYVYDLIQRHLFTDEAGENRMVWQLILPAESRFDRRSARKEERVWWLTDPYKDPDLIDAMTTFNFVGDEVGRKKGYTHPIPYDQVTEWLTAVRKQDARERVGYRVDEDGRVREPPKNDDWLQKEVGTSFDYLPAELEAIKDRDKQWKARLFAAQIDRLKERFDRLYNHVRGQGRPPDPIGGKNFDLVCVFALMLGDEIKKLRQGIRSLTSAEAGQRADELVKDLGKAHTI